MRSETAIITAILFPQKFLTRQYQLFTNPSSINQSIIGLLNSWHVS